MKEKLMNLMNLVKTKTIQYKDSLIIEPLLLNFYMRLAPKKSKINIKGTLTS